MLSRGTDGRTRPSIMRLFHVRPVNNA